LTLPGELSTEEGLRLIKEVATYRPKPLLLLLTGGDPLGRGTSSSSSRGPGSFP
jgi:MoaA/NifB/PqqE/SkfB family radical SAM enzyme